MDHVDRQLKFKFNFNDIYEYFRLDLRAPESQEMPLGHKSGSCTCINMHNSQFVHDIVLVGN